MMILVAIALSLLIGVSLGLLGGGGSILTVPILIYALGMEDKNAIASSLLIVGVTSLVASIQHARAGNVVWRVAVIFASGAMVGAYVGGRFAKFIPGTALLVVFAVIMFGASLAMWRGRKPSVHDEARASQPLPIARILLQGLVVGSVTGLVGAGGGFLIVPALALLGKLSMPKAVGSSLVVIACSTFAGFAGYATHAHIDWQMTFVVMGAAVMGSFVGASLSKKVSPQVLRKGFAIFVFVMALLVLGKQLLGEQARAYFRGPPAGVPTTLYKSFETSP